MKNYCRISKYTEYGYQKIAIQLFTKQPFCQYSFNSFGSVIFTKFNDKFDSVKFIVESDNFEDFADMAKLMKYVKENTNWSYDVSEFLQVVGCIELVNFNFSFIPVSENGNFVFNCYDSFFNEETNKHEKCNSIYTSICAPNQLIAEKLAKKLYPKLDFVIEKGKKIEIKPFDFAVEYQLN